MIKGLSFVGCGGKTRTVTTHAFIKVEQLTVEDTTFEGFEGSGTALALIETNATSIVNSVFLHNTKISESPARSHDFISLQQDHMVLSTTEICHV